MLRNLKSLGLALVAVLALGASLASAASAAEFHSSVDNTVLTGEQVETNEFTVDTGRVECEVAHFSGSVSGTTTTSTVTVTPKYEECTLAGQAAVVKMNGCDYMLHAAGTADLVCPGSAKVEVVGKECTVTVAAQNGLGPVSFANAANGDVTVTAAVNNVAYEEHGAKCKNQTVATTGGTYTGSVLVEGKDLSNNPVHLTYF